jgi:amidohydrolase
VRSSARRLHGAANDIHARPELAFAEHFAAQRWCDVLTDGGFDVRLGVDSLDTAFVAIIGSGPTTVALCAEYDALAGMGHACGHNLIGAASVGAALALRELVDDLGLTVKVIGCPGEEGGGGKALLIERGIFDGVDAAMMVHPFGSDVLLPPHLAVEHWDVCYHGKAAHASSRPSAGVNAADAMTIANVAVGLLRQQLRSTDRVHGVTTNGGDAPNVIPQRTDARWYVRSVNSDHLDALIPRVRGCFEAGAVGTGCTLDIDQVSPRYLDLRHHRGLAECYRANAESLGRTFLDAPLEVMQRYAGSTDMGNVSHLMPVIHPMIGLESRGASTHEGAFADACTGPSADQLVIDGAIALALTAIDVANDPTLLLA